FFEKKFSNPNHFNQAVWLYRETGFDKDYIERSFTKIVRHHDALRMVYKISGNKVIQENRGTGDHRLFDMKVFDISRDPPGQQIQKEADRLQRGINLQTGPLVKLALFKTRHGDRLLIVIHHLVVDGVSWRILLEDFKTAYEQLEKGNSVTFRDKTDSFQYWAYKQRQYAKSRRLCGELKYWEHIFALARGVHRLPKDADAGERKYKACKQLSLVFSPHQTKQLLEQTNHAYNTRINDLLLTALALSLHKWSGLKFFFVNLEGHGREKIIHDVDINRTIGWFTSQFPVLLDISKGEDREDHDELSHHIRYIKETLRNVPGKGIGFGILSYLSPFGRKLSRRKTPEICFNYLGEFGRESKPGIFEFSELNRKNNIGPGMEQPYALDISGIVINGELTLDFRYNKNEYKKETVKNLAGYYKDALHEITRHCAAKRQKQLTPSDYGDNRLSLEDLDKITKIYREGPPIEKIYALSPMQEGFLFHRLLDSRSTAYFEQSTLYLEGKVDPVILQKSINILIHRHDILRSSLVHREIEKPRQVVLKERNIKVEFKDLSPRTKEEREREITAYKKADLGQGFDLTADPLLRFTLFKIKKTSWLLIWSFHHILM
ncbi:MAG: non-ribosomal peptide synthetase, partial [bacterium]|nr:non-ribosomal peptide synthetase [bacterium]